MVAWKAHLEWARAWWSFYFAHWWSLVIIEILELGRIISQIGEIVKIKRKLRLVELLLASLIIVEVWLTELWLAELILGVWWESSIIRMWLRISQIAALVLEHWWFYLFNVAHWEIKISWWSASVWVYSGWFFDLEILSDDHWCLVFTIFILFWTFRVECLIGLQGFYGSHWLDVVVNALRIIQEVSWGVNSGLWEVKVLVLLLEAELGFMKW